LIPVVGGGAGAGEAEPEPDPAGLETSCEESLIPDTGRFGLGGLTRVDAIPDHQHRRSSVTGDWQPAARCPLPTPCNLHPPRRKLRCQLTAATSLHTRPSGLTCCTLRVSPRLSTVARESDRAAQVQRRDRKWRVVGARVDEENRGHSVTQRSSRCIKGRTYGWTSTETTLGVTVRCLPLSPY
jgi:hypothetical protein